MIALALLPWVTSLALGLWGPRLARRLSGRAATVQLTVVTLACALSTGLVLCAIGCLALAQWPPFAALGHWSVPALIARDPLPPAVDAGCGVVALVLLGASLARVVVSLRQLGRSAALCRELDATHTGGLVVLEDDEPEAYALAGLPGRAVVTRAMLRTLSGPERRALLAHENAHVGHYHFVYLNLVRLAVTANPLLVPLLPAVRTSVERWADDDAAEQVADRGLVATTLARASLARAQHFTVPQGALGVAESDVRQRLHALLEHPSGRTTRAAVSAALLLAALACCLSSGEVGLHLHELIEWAQSIGPAGG